MPQIPHVLPALTVRQPWADLIVNGDKDVENRSWPTDYRGPLLIHASKTVSWEAVHELQHDRLLPRHYQPVTGAVLGIVEVVGCVTAHPSEFFHGPFGFTLRHPRRFSRPVPLPGQPGIFRVPMSALGDVASEIEGFAQIATSALYQAGT